MKKKSFSFSLLLAVVIFAGAVFVLPGCKGGSQIKPSAYGIKSKKALEYYLKGLDFEKYRDRKTAILNYEQAIAIEPDFGEPHFRMGVDKYFLIQSFQFPATEWPNVLEHLQTADKLLSREDRSPLLNFYLAEAAFYNQKYTMAREKFQEFLDGRHPVKKEFVEVAKLNLKHAVYAEKAIEKTIKFEPKNLGENINSLGEEYLPYLTADDEVLFFTARREESTGDYSAELRGYPEDFFYSEYKDGEWSKLVNLGSPVNTPMNEGAASFSPDGQLVYFTACDRRDGFGSCDIYVAKLEGRKWTEPKNLGPIVNTPHWDSQPCISNDGKTLYFASSRPGGKGRADIWYTTYQKGAWTAPKNLGEPINTVGSENSPFLHADGQTLYFSSDDHPGFGGFDLFLSKRIKGGWSRPQNLGYPLNSISDEKNIFVNTKGTLGFTNSNRLGGMGGYDLYSFEMDESIRPNFATFVRGVVLDNVSSSPLRSELTFVNFNSGDTIRAVESNSASGKFLLSLPLDEDYVAFVGAKGYLYKSQNFSLKGVDPEKDPYFDLIIRLDPIQEGSNFVLENIFYETARFNLKDESRAELDHLVYFMKINPRITIELGGHTDNVGSKDANQILSENRANEVKKYLVDKGIPSARITAVGYGETQPKVPNTTDENRAENRRTELKITGK